MRREVPRPRLSVFLHAAPPARHAPDAHLPQAAPHVDAVHDQGLHRPRVQYLHVEHDPIKRVVLVVLGFDRVGVVHEVVGALLEDEGGHVASVLPPQAISRLIIPRASRTQPEKRGRALTLSSGFARPR